jgi:hypothetical protein
MVDLIAPLGRGPFKPKRHLRLSAAADELVAAQVEGLEWLENVRHVSSVAIDEQGLPLRLVVPHPHIFAAHKLWLSGRSDRDPLKRRRDRAQAEVVARLLQRRPDLELGRKELAAAPLRLLEALEGLRHAAAGAPSSEPEW